MKLSVFVRNCLVGFCASASVLTATAAALPTEMAANDRALTQIGAYAAWARGYTGQGIRIGFVDTGADLTNKDLKNVVLSKSPYYSTMRDVTRGHGTAMISLAAAAKDGTGIVGVAYNSSVLAYAGGIGGSLYVPDVNNGIRWNADNLADVINLSLGMRETTAVFNASYQNLGAGNYLRLAKVSDAYSNTAMLSSLQYATSKGSIVVMAAGNDGNPVPTSPANLAVKVDASGNLMLGGRAVIVGAVDNNNVIASFSNRAGNICQSMVNGSCADKVQIKDYFLVAPGGSLVWGANANNGTNIAQDVGTSASAAFVSGGVALIKQAWPTLKPEQIVQILLKTATDLGKAGVDEVYGNGLMNLDAATKPVGTLALAKITTSSSNQIAASSVQVSASGLSASGILGAQSLANSEVLKNIQVVDSEGRNFSLNMTQGVAAAPIKTSLRYYDPVSAFSGLSTASVNRVDFDVLNGAGAYFSSDNMSGLKLGHAISTHYSLSFEYGNASERGALLGTSGAGALALGNSSTDWAVFGLARKLSDTHSVFGSVGYGTTKASAMADSLITGFSDIITQTWTLGVKREQVFHDKDSLTVQLTQLPAIVSGTATISGVTGYTYSDVTDEGAKATPVVSTEKVSLVTDYRQYASTFAYATKLSKTSDLGLRYTLGTDNLGSEPSHFVGLNYLKRF